MNNKFKAIIVAMLLQSTNTIAADIFKADKLYKTAQYTEAKKEYLAAAEVGNPHAFYQLANMAFKGLGSEQNLVDAMVYFSLAAEYKFHNSEQIIDKILASLSSESLVAVNSMVADYQKKYGKQVIEKKLFPEINQPALENKITFDGKEKLDTKFFSEDFVDSSIASFANADVANSFDDEDESATNILMSTPKKPFLIVDVDIAKDGSIRNYSEVQKFGDVLSAGRLLDDFVLFPMEKPEYKSGNVDFVHRAFLGAAIYSKFTLVEENDWLYREVIMTARKLKKSTALNDRYQYAMALLNFPWLKQEEGEAEQLMLAAAKFGHPGAMYEYGLMLYREQRNITDAVYWIGQASKYGLTRAEYRLAKILQSSPWVKNDEQKALFWYQQAAKKEHIPAIIRATEIKLTAKDERLKDLAGAIENLAYLEDKHKNNPEYYYLLALSHKDRENRDYTQVISNLRTAIMKGQTANWDVTEWQDLLLRLTTGNVTIQDHS